MPKPWKPILISCAVSVLAFAILAACAPLPAAPVSPIATPSQPTLEAPMASPTPPPQTPIPSAGQLAVADLAAHLSIAVDAITVVSVEEVEWNDASLGCPKPGMMYAQVITPGHRIVLEVDGKIYEYHTGGGGIVRCQP